MDSNRMGSGRSEPEARRSLAIGVWVVLILIGLVVASRRLAGAFTAEFPTLIALIGAAAVAGLSLAAALLLRGGRPSERTADARVLAGVTLIPPLLFGLALLPSGATAGYSALATLLLFAFAAVWVVGQSSSLPQSLLARRGPDAGSAAVTSTVVSPASDRQTLGIDSVPAQSSLDLAEFTESDEEAEDSRVSQWMTRRFDDGVESIEGAATAAFQPGQKQASVHVAFCPPFPQPPEVTCEILSDESGRVRVASAHTYGARLDVRFSSPATSEQIVRVGFEAICPVTRNDAA